MDTGAFLTGIGAGGFRMPASENEHISIDNGSRLLRIPLA